MAEIAEEVGGSESLVTPKKARFDAAPVTLPPKSTGAQSSAVTPTTPAEAAQICALNVARGEVLRRVGLRRLGLQQVLQHLEHERTRLLADRQRQVAHKKLQSILISETDLVSGMVEQLEGLLL